MSLEQQYKEFYEFLKEEKTEGELLKLFFSGYIPTDNDLLEKILPQKERKNDRNQSKDKS